MGGEHDTLRCFQLNDGEIVNPRRVALVEAPPRDGFVGLGDAEDGTVTLRDRSEDISVEVDAATPGFVVLTDQYYPGWTATVDGSGAEILRANYVFRAVHVPAGRSTVRFSYRPRSVLLGGMISLASGIAVAASAVAGLRRKWKPCPPAAAVM